MKKIIFIVLAIASFSFSIKAQVNIKKVTSVNFYGVDFSLAKAFGVQETPQQLKGGVSAINNMFIAEFKKYDIQKFMGKAVISYEYASTNKNNDNIDAQEFASNSQVNNLSDEDIKGIVNSLKSESNDKIGLVFIAEMLNKANVEGVYHVIFFEEATKQIIYSKKVTGKPGGFGVRNFWAGSIFDFMRTWQY